MSKEIKNIIAEQDIIHSIEEHNCRCGKVQDMFLKDNDVIIDTMRQGNVRVGIEHCYIARENKIDVVVDTVWGYVFPRNSVFEDEIVDGKKRYLIPECAGGRER